MNDKELRRLEEDAVLSPRVFGQLNAEYQAAGQQLDQELDGLYQNQSELEAEELHSTRTHLLRVERVTLQELYRQGAVDTVSMQKLAAELDARLVAVSNDAAIQPAPAPISHTPATGELTLPEPDAPDAQRTQQSTSQLPRS